MTLQRYCQSQIYNFTSENKINWYLIKHIRLWQKFFLPWNHMFIFVIATMSTLFFFYFWDSSLNVSSWIVWNLINRTLAPWFIWNLNSYSAHWNNTLRIDISPHSDTLFWFWANPSLLFLLNVLNGEATNTNFIVFGLTRSGLEPTTYRTVPNTEQQNKNVNVRL
jgi:hypothetical protein